MLKKNIIFVCLAVFCAMAESCNNKYPFKSPYYGAVGFVIGKETCNADLAKDYWLVEVFSSSSVRQQYGDTLILNGVRYTNAIKVTGLADPLKNIGAKIGFDFTIADTATVTQNCTANTPGVYKLKLAEIKQSSPAVF